MARRSKRVFSITSRLPVEPRPVTRLRPLASTFKFYRLAGEPYVSDMDFWLRWGGPRPYPGCCLDMAPTPMRRAA